MQEFERAAEPIEQEVEQNPTPPVPRGTYPPYASDAYAYRNMEQAQGSVPPMREQAAPEGDYIPLRRQTAYAPVEEYGYSYPSQGQIPTYREQGYVPPMEEQGYDPNIPPFTPPSKKEKKKASSGKKLLIFALCFSLLGSLLGGGCVLLLQRAFAKEETQNEVSYILEGRREPVELESVVVDTGKLMSPAEVYAANVKSTVGITTTSTTTNFWGFWTTSAATGSGFFISNEGHILTNYHVIAGSDSISVSLYSGESYEAELIGYDDTSDIAILKIDAGQTVPVILGDSDQIHVGDSVVAIGNPLGELTFSLTSGSVSAKDREVTFSGSVSMELIQTDCAINSGNSGGALFNLYGEVIGVTNAKYSGASASATIDNIGFAIPMNSIREIIRGIMEDGYILKSYAGVSVSDLGFEAQFYGLPMGAYVEAVDPNGPAASVLQRGDIIVGLDNMSISGGEQFIHIVESSDVGQVLKLSVYRQGQTLTLDLVVGQYRHPTLPDNTQGVYY